MHTVYVFDAYGTLFDTSAAVHRHAGDLGEAGERLAALWRRKQLEYSWVRSLMGPCERDFWQLTVDALDHALAAVPEADRALREPLLEAYRDLDTYPEVPQVLGALKDRGAKLAILSNGSHEMLERAIRSAGLAQLFDRVFSAEDIKRFKVWPDVYDMVGTAYRVYPHAVSFQSSNRWDIAGAARFGFTTVWINRTRQPDEYLDLPPTAVLPDLKALPTML
ncbi:haloacid dehalogenase type II [Consotaella salsifontis]|uniref:(S)-2-haloacid dehalogenase n=1 Tax=Consotaella salsifontis TaxID=1365950 RepID=A0A1T4NMU3_9HYPH|nr:haloacid dehalogenase type II [Consotaella salsifontis]SJZ80641.1 2-haloacid dehalogenase [Consotaella salsifontis]